jgi:hypothetical protein
MGAVSAVSAGDVDISPLSAIQRALSAAQPSLAALTSHLSPNAMSTNPSRA